MGEGCVKCQALRVEIERLEKALALTEKLWREAQVATLDRFSTGLKITILGEPASKANSRQLVTLYGRPASIKSVKALDYVAAAIPQLKVQRLTPFKGDVAVSMDIYYATRRPDLDESVILDVLQGFAYKNDRQVKEKLVRWHLDKTNPRAVVRVVGVRG